MTYDELMQFAEDERPKRVKDIEIWDLYLHDIEIDDIADKYNITKEEVVAAVQREDIRYLVSSVVDKREPRVIIDDLIRQLELLKEHMDTQVV
jgi:hypothetical protein